MIDLNPIGLTLKVAILAIGLSMICGVIETAAMPNLDMVKEMIIVSAVASLT